MQTIKSKLASVGFGLFLGTWTLLCTVQAEDLGKRAALSPSREKQQLQVTERSENQFTEAKLLSYIDEGAPSVARIYSAFHANEAALHQFKDQFSPEAFSQLSMEETNERAVIDFAPVFTPVRTAAIGVRKNFAWGGAFTTQIAMDQRSANSGITNIQSATTLSGIMSLNVDLWKDLFGRRSRAKLDQLKASEQAAELAKKIDLHTFKLAVRKIYWQLVANWQSHSLTKKLLDKAKNQLSTILKKQKSSVADQTDVARYQSQVSERKANLLYLEYQKDLLIQNLRNLIPKIEVKDLSFEGLDLNQTTHEVVSCTETIASFETIPKENTLYDDLIAHLEKQKQYRLEANETYDDVDLMLNTQVQTIGVDQGSGAVGTLGGAWNDLSSQNRFGYAVGLSLNIPLDGSKAKTKRIQDLKDEFEMDSRIKDYQAKMRTTHEQLLKSIQYLSQVISLQKENSQFLKSRLKGINRKYQQARIDVSILVNDQTSQLSADLSVIQTQVEFINTLFDYFSVFTLTPCEFNRGRL